jgi:uncharacterized protein
MIRQITAVAMVTFAAGILQSCSQAPVSNTEPIAEISTSAENTVLLDKATTLVDQLMLGEFSPVIAEFDATMTAAMPESLLTTTMTQLQQQVGRFKERTAIRQAEETGYDVVYVTCVFEKTSLNAKVVYGKDGRVAGLFFLPA